MARSLAAAIFALGALSLAPLGCASSEGPRETIEPNVLRERAAELRRIPFKVRPGGRLVLEGFDGDVHVSAAQREQPELLAHLGAISSDLGSARSMLKRIDIEVDRRRDQTVIRFLGPDREKEDFRTNSRYDISAPPGIAVVVESEVGGISIEGAFRAARAQTNYGWVRVAGVRGSIEIDNGSGDVEVLDVQGERIAVGTDHGNLTLRDLTCRTFRVRCDSGNLEVQRVSADQARLDSSYGTLEIEDIECKRLNLHAGLSEISLVGCRSERIDVEIEKGQFYGRDIRAALNIHAPSAETVVEEFEGSLIVTSTYGSIRASGLFSVVEAVTKAGSVQIDAREGSLLTGPWTLKSRYEGVELSLPEGLGFLVDARSAYGDVHLGLPVVVDARRTIDRRRIRGEVNGGGPRIRASTVNGDIQIGIRPPRVDPLGLEGE